MVFALFYIGVVVAISAVKRLEQKSQQHTNRNNLQDIIMRSNVPPDFAMAFVTVRSQQGLHHICCPVQSNNTGYNLSKETVFN